MFDILKNDKNEHVDFFRSLKCNRTRIHRNLFVAIIIYVIIRLIVNIDQYFAKGGELVHPSRRDSGAIHDTVSESNSFNS